MMRVAVISDSHNAGSMVRMFIERAQREHFDQIIHCGDGERDVDTIRMHLDPIGIPTAAVSGNCDMGMARRELTLELAGHRVYVVHGDRWSVRRDLSALSYRTMEVGADVALYGHTHEPLCVREGGLLILNPGALRNGCYAVLSIDADGITPELRTL